MCQTSQYNTTLSFPAITNKNLPLRVHGIRDTLHNTLITHFRLSRVPFRCLEMHSKRGYKICICSLILGELESFRNYRGFSINFPKTLKCNLTYYESETFSDLSLHCSFESENFRFPFLYEKKPHLVYCWQRRPIYRSIYRYSDRQSVDSRSIVGRQSIDSRSTVGRQSVDSSYILQKIVGNLLDKLRIFHEWNGHLEIFSRRQIIENSRQYLLLRTDISQKTVVGSP